MPWLIVGLLLRLAFAAKLGGRQHQIDESAFYTAGLEWARTGSLPGVIPPIPTAFIALWTRLGESMVWPRIGQAFVGTATAWAIGKAASDLTGSSKAGRIALAVACVYPFFVYYNGMLLSETLYLAAAVPGLWLLCRAMRGAPGSEKTAAAAGAFLAAAALCRAEGAFIAGPLWLIVAATRRMKPRVWAAGVAVWLLPLLGWSARTQALTGRFALDIHGGMTLLHGTMLLEANEMDTGVAQREFEKTELFKASMTLPDPERDAVYMKAAFAYMRDNPGATVRGWARKFVNFWRFYPRTDKVYQQDAMSRPDAGAPRWALTAVSLLSEPALILGGLWGLWLLRRRLVELSPLPLWLLGTMGIHVLSVSQMRYRLPVMPVLIIAAAYAATRPKAGRS